MSSGEHDPLARVEDVLGIVTREHAAIFALHRRLVELGRADASSQALLRESARVAVQDAPEAVRGARAAVLDETLHRLLDPSAPTLSAASERAIRHAEDRLRALLRRQLQIADELARSIERGRES